MPCSTTYITCINTFCSFLMLSPTIAGMGLVPRDFAADDALARRACEPAAPDVSESSIITDVCNQTPADDISLCYNQMTVHMQRSAANTCGQYLGLLTKCIMANNDHTICSDALFGYQDCNKYTMQAYAYCGCYYTLPASIADCANGQLQPQTQDTATPQPTVTAIPNGSDMVASASSADENPTTAVSASPSSQSTTTSSDPQIPATPTLHTTSPRQATPSRDVSTAGTTTAARSPNSAPTTITSTDLIISTTPATPTLIPTSTVYTCADGGGAASVLTVPTPHSVVMSAQGIAQGTTARFGKHETSASQSPSVATKAPELRPSATAGSNLSAGCARCRRRSKIL